MPSILLLGSPQLLLSSRLAILPGVTSQPQVDVISHNNRSKEILQARGGIPTLELRNSNENQNRQPTESTENSSTDDSSGDESANSIDEAGKARI